MEMMHAAGPPGWAAVRRATLGVLLLSLLWALAAVAYPSSAEAAPPGALTANSTGVLEIITVPKVAGARFVVDGRIHRANSQGVVRLKVKSLDRHKVSVVDKKISQSNRTLTFDRWYTKNHDKDHLEELSGLVVRRNLRINAGYRASYTLHYSFVDQAHRPVKQERVSRVEFRGDHGQTVTGNGSGMLAVLGIRPIESGGALIAKRINYTVQRIDVDGSNVVQVNEQRFEPSRKATVVIPLQLHTVHFSTRDLLFGSPVGQAVWLKYPDGHRFRVPLDRDGTATVNNLARGNYTVQVDAPGLAFERPLVISRNQYVDLQHVTNLDIGVAAGAVAALMLSLYVVRVRGRSGVLRAGGFGSSRMWAATQRIPRVKKRTQHNDDRAAAATKIPKKKQLAAHKPNSSQDSRAQVKAVQLPDHLARAAPYEIQNLERTSTRIPDSGVIGARLDTDVELPPNTETTESTDIKVECEADPAAAEAEELDTTRVDSEQVDAENLQSEEVEPAAADTEMVDGEKADQALAGETTWPLPPWTADAEVDSAATIDPAAATDDMPDTVGADSSIVDEDTVDPTAGNEETADTADSDADDDVTVDVPAALAVDGGGQNPDPQLLEQHDREPAPAKNPAEKKRVGSPVISAIASAVVLVGTLLYGLSRDGGVTAQSVTTGTATSSASEDNSTTVPSHQSAVTGTEQSAIQLKSLAYSAKPFETVPIQGTYRGGGDTLVRMQRWQAGKWLEFPLPTKTDQSGQFTARVELGQPSRHQLRVLDPSSGVTSKPFVLVIKA